MKLKFWFHGREGSGFCSHADSREKSCITVQEGTPERPTTQRSHRSPAEDSKSDTPHVPSAAARGTLLFTIEFPDTGAHRDVTMAKSHTGLLTSYFSHRCNKIIDKYSLRKAMA